MCQDVPRFVDADLSPGRRVEASLIDGCDRESKMSCERIIASFSRPQMNFEQDSQGGPILLLSLGSCTNLHCGSIEKDWSV